MIRRPPRSTLSSSSAASDVYKRRAHRNADNVLPEPVGATTRVWAPELMASQAPICAAVGSAKLPLNQSRVAGENRASTSELIVNPACHLWPTTWRHEDAFLARSAHPVAAPAAARSRWAAAWPMNPRCPGDEDTWLAFALVGRGPVPDDARLCRGYRQIGSDPRCR